ncbi:MAG: polymer-forming cytoskeletal protein [Deltaproteobacteria bacterium]|jgi:cytoskeletal protein CcmA (bactofilin family)
MAESAGIIGKGIRIKGELSGTGELVVAGEIDGRIDLSDHLKVDESGVVNAEISAKQLTVFGKASGDMTANEKIEVKASATVIGDVKTPSIMIEDGATFRGNVHMDVQLPEGVGRRS